MTKAQFISAIEAKPNFIKWAKSPETIETIGDIEKCHGIAYITTPDGRQVFNVWFLNDTVANEATWQQQDALEPEANTNNVKMNALTSYLKANFVAYFLVRYDLNNNWAEADVFAVSGQDLTKSNVLVYKQGSNPITHRIIL